MTNHKIRSLWIEIPEPGDNGIPVVTIHIHREEGGSIVTRYSIFAKVETFGAGPSYESYDSSGDMHGNGNRQGGNEASYNQCFYDIIVDPDNIYLYKGSFRYVNANEGKRKISLERQAKVPLETISKVRKDE